jgi:hypothetical protein
MDTQTTQQRPNQNDLLQQLYEQLQQSLQLLPDCLKGRLAVHENTQLKNSYVLTILCADLSNPITQTVDHFLFSPAWTIFQRQDGWWCMCHTWNRMWGESSKAGTSFINITSGERYDTVYLVGWRSSLQVSPDGNMILLHAPLQGCSEMIISVYDISRLPFIRIIHKEISNSLDVECEVKFNEQNEVVCVYWYKFSIYKDKIRFDAIFDDNLELEKYVLNDAHTSHYIPFIEDRGGRCIKTSCTVKRKRNCEDVVGKDIGSNVTETISEEFFTQIHVNDMIMTKFITSKDYDLLQPFMKKGMSHLDLL